MFITKKKLEARILEEVEKRMKEVYDRQWQNERMENLERKLFELGERMHDMECRHHFPHVQHDEVGKKPSIRSCEDCVCR